MGRINDDDSPHTPDTNTPITIHATAATDIESGTSVSNTAANANANTNQAAQPKTWKGYLWDTWDLPQDQRRLLFKVDALVLTFSSIGYFLKNLDQTNVNNAFLSGMKEDLGMWGDELVTSTSHLGFHFWWCNLIGWCGITGGGCCHLRGLSAATCDRGCSGVGWTGTARMDRLIMMGYLGVSIWTVGYVIGQIPSNLLLTRVSPRYVIPSLEVGWGIATIATSAVQSYRSLYALRFLVGFFE
jgi:hypothetical protein